ncbi:MAG: hypothetical protein AAGC62_03070 [Pseudomonadota bacterium]
MQPSDLHRSRKILGAILGESVHAALLSLGLIVGLAFLLNGFDAMATARFAHNALDRMLGADPARQATFGWTFAGVFSLGVIGVLVVRFIDRVTVREAGA